MNKTISDIIETLQERLPGAKVQFLEDNLGDTAGAIRVEWSNRVYMREIQHDEMEWLEQDRDYRNAFPGFVAIRAKNEIEPE